MAYTKPASCVLRQSSLKHGSKIGTNQHTSTNRALVSSHHYLDEDDDYHESRNCVKQINNVNFQCLNMINFVFIEGDSSLSTDQLYLVMCIPHFDFS